MLAPITIEAIRPATPSRRFPAKAALGEVVTVSADVFADGHDVVRARLRWRDPSGDTWLQEPMRHVGNDRWVGSFEPRELGGHEFVVEAWRSRFETWRHDVEVKAGIGDELELELEEGALILDDLAARVADPDASRLREAASALRMRACTVDTRLNAGLDDRVAHLVEGVPDAHLSCSTPQPLWVDRRLAAMGAWYELFPRSEGGLSGAVKRLPVVADMGFDVVYLPPIHPVGKTARKGPNNTPVAGPGDPGSPWAIGSADGGHTAVAPELGTLDDFRALLSAADELGLEVALDLALQCSPDHPWVHDHPEWFHRRPDGSIRYAENPPKKYQDIFPINFWPKDHRDREALWIACLDVVRFWIGQGVKIFRVDNPHTKPLAFWAWVIERIRAEAPEVILLAEAFTRPKMMAKLAEVGFSQSYTYFTWRETAQELREYVEELAHGPTADYMRPNFWPNTPDILAGGLRNGRPAAFKVRLVLAALLVPSYGIYSGYELCENEPASEANEEYLNSEKYEIKARDWDRPDSLAPLVATLNDIRRRHPCLANLRDVRFHGSTNDWFLVWSRGHLDKGDLVLVVVNLDPEDWHETTLALDLAALGLPAQGRYTATDELGGQTYTWSGPNPYVRLDPNRGQVAHVLSLTKVV